mgnify:CR=1 FL=1|tara:strand:+ start:287 stop:547 length:261 start_codon:yes stop_codon:yes gene_type:complete
MAEEIKFIKEELKQIEDIQNNYISIQNNFGQLKLAQIRLDDQEVDLEEFLKKTQEKEKKFLDGITKKYGEGTLDPKTNIFTPNKSK